MFSLSSRYRSPPDADHDRNPVIGVLLVNLGTPESPSVRHVRRFLAAFLADPRVVEAPRWLWRPFLHGVILRIRPTRSAAAYRQVWTPDGSPLMVNSRRLRAALQVALDEDCPGALRVGLAMRYGQPSVREGLAKLVGHGVDHLVVLPVYPQYSGTTTGSAFDGVAQEVRTWRRVPPLRFIAHYHDHPGYIEALAESVIEAWEHQGRSERLLLSFHGIPERYCRRGDPYFRHCEKTAHLLADRLGLEPPAYAIAFQSRVGRQAWLRPYTETLLSEWAAGGVRSVQVLCPGFAADCLETLEEIAIRARDLFRSAGGESLSYISALNDRPRHVSALADLILDETVTWRAKGPD